MGNDRLAAALAAFRESNTAATQQRVLDELVRSELIFPTAEPGPRATGLQLGFTDDQLGRPILPGFTDEHHLSIWLRSGGPYAKARAAGFLPAFLEGPFVGLALNPGSEASVLVDRRAVELLAAGRKAHLTDYDGEEALVREWFRPPRLSKPQE